MSFSLVSIYYYYRVLRENVAALKDTIKTTGQKQDSALNGIPRDLAKTHSSFSTTENQVCIILVGNSKPMTKNYF